MRSWKVSGAAVLIAACGEPTAGTPRLAAPTIQAAWIRANAHNALSAIASVRVKDADSAQVRFMAVGADSSGDVILTPAVRVSGDSAELPVLGLFPTTRYLLRPIAYGPGGTVSGDEIEFITGALPSDLPAYDAEGTDPAPGFVVFAALRYGLVVDNTGRVVWYRHFGNTQVLNFMVEAPGRYLVRPATSDPLDVEPWMEIDAAGDLMRTFGCALGMPARLHDAISDGDGGHWLMCDETRTMDLTSVGGAVAARVTGTVIQHVAGDGSLLFHWTPFDHFALTDADPAALIGAAVNWTHGNALDFDADGNLVVSFRNLGEITKIAASTGAVIWRLGGRRNQFTFLDTDVPAFSGQHSARIPAPDALLLLDNLGDPNASRAERYDLDERALTARLVRSYGSMPGVVTTIGGSVQDLPGGHTLVSFGTAGRVEEYDAAGRVVWRITGNPGYVFRAQRIRSLYALGMGTSR